MRRILWALASSAILSFAASATAGERLGTAGAPVLAASSTLVEALPEPLRRSLRGLLGLPPELRYDARWLARQPRATGGTEFRCLAEALYFEARGESVRGQAAVAEVILNRRDSGLFPATVCGVVNQGTGRRHQCQFSYTCDGHTERIREPAAYERVAKVARLMLDGAPRVLTGGALWYHNHRVRPSWSRRFQATAAIGAHRFYRR